MDEIVNKSENKLFYVALALFAIDFFLQGMSIFFVLATITLFWKRNVFVGKQSLILAMFAISFIAFFAISGYFELSIVQTVICVLLAFVLGQNMKNVTDKKIVYVLIFLSLFMAAHALLNLFYNFSQFGSSALSISRSYDFWTKEISGATGQASKLSPFIAVFFYLFYYTKKMAVRLGAVAVLIAAIIYDMELGGRSALILLAVSIVLSIALGMIKAKNFKSCIKLFIFVFGMITLGVIAYNSDLFGIKTMFENSYFSHRFYSASGQSITEDSRMSRKVVYISHMFDFPLGGKRLSVDMGIGHAHELWLDIFDMVGIVPYFLILVYSICSISRAIKFFKLSNVDFRISNVYLVFVVVMNLQFFVEPILEGSPKLLIMYCLIDGMVYRYLNSIKYYSQGIIKNENKRKTQTV